MHKDESLWVKRLYRSIKPHHLANQEPDSLLGYDSNGTPVVVQGGSGITISGGTISAGGGGSGTVTSVGLSAPTGLSVTGSPVTTSGTLALSFTSGYSIPTNAKQTNWDTAYGWGNHASAGYATTTYVDNLMDGLKWKSSVKVATTGNITLSGEQTIDGVLTSSNRVLVWQQSDQTQNGIYTSNSGAWTRSTDASTGTELVSAAVNVEAGSTYADIEFVNTNNSITIGVDNITFVTRASTTNHNNLSGLQGGTTNEYYHLTAAQHGIATAPTLANISSFSTNTAKSLYTMTSATPVEFRTSGATPLLYLNESGRVGIGTNSALDLLDVRGGLVVSIDGSNYTTLGTTPSGILNIIPSGSRVDIVGGITATTNCGIGTTSPTTKLTVVDTSSSSPRGILSVQTSTDTAGARVGFAKARGTFSSPTTIVSGDTLGRLMFRGYDGSSYLEMGSIEVVSNGTIATNRVPTYMAFSTATDAAPSVLTERMRITDSGRVGIGTISPSVEFHISVPQARMRLTSTTGTNSTYSEMVNTGGSFLFGQENSTGGNIFTGSTAYAGVLGTTSARPVQIATNNSIVMTILSGGNVGIGTTSPDRLFHVESSDAATNTVTYTQRNTHITSGTATTGFGLGKEWELENGSGTNVVAATEEVTWSDATNATEDATYTLKLVKAGALTTALSVTSTGNVTVTGRLLGAKGADVASANDLTLGSDGNLFHITGTTQINAITTTGWTAGSSVVLIFDGSITVKHNTAGGGSTAVILLAGGVDFSATTNDTLTLIYEGTRWFETSRTVI